MHLGYATTTMGSCKEPDAQSQTLTPMEALLTADVLTPGCTN